MHHDRKLRRQPGWPALVIVAAGLFLSCLPAASAVRAARTGAAECVSLLVNGDFEGGPGVGWSETGDEICDPASGCDLICDQYPHSGDYGAWLGDYDGADATLSQMVTIPAEAGRVTLSYWWAVFTQEESHPHDLCRVEVRSASGDLLQALQVIEDSDDVPLEWARSQFDLTAYKGQTVQLVFHAVTDATGPTGFFFDDVALEACAAETQRLIHLPLLCKS